MLGTISIILKILYYKTSILLQVNTLTTCTFSLVNKNVCRSQNIFWQSVIALSIKEANNTDTPT